MNFIFKAYHQTRFNFFELINSLSEEQLNKIPQGFKNNVIWNLGHVITTQQLLTYGLSDLPKICDEEFIEQFRKGTSPVKSYSKEEIFSILFHAKSSLIRLESDYYDKKFVNFKPYDTSFGVQLNSIEEAIYFLSIHEALHLGYAMAIRKTI